MEPLTVVERFEIGEDDVFCLSASAESIPINALRFKRCPEAFHRGIVKTVVGATETHLNPKLFKDRPVLGAGVLRTAIRMMQQAWLRLARAQLQWLIDQSSLKRGKIKRFGCDQKPGSALE